ncbi:uncharacterized protein F5891DRAFT_337232 [Suillus fuscotomentosus]|uniref:Uncharacterized protein n=1 Tax=Suillus fuscotomentosus TaxID=1912939 RepID=A0AAD4E5L2_9AGAM|nr:uncharacterized protein F5891DRAFT_337232 [Suillus fuscotomentosus]KAG1900005.1 hypothetical protein F5891DRAFT_337232 [Suillus fuscotomentosus]
MSIMTWHTTNSMTSGSMMAVWVIFEVCAARVCCLYLVCSDCRNRAKIRVISRYLSLEHTLTGCPFLTICAPHPRD